MAKLKPGDVIRIPFDGRYALAKTLYLSETVEDVFGFTVLARCFDKGDAVEVGEVPYLTFELGIGNVKVLYVSRKTVEKDGSWTIVGSLSVTEADRAPLVHGVGGGLYRDNELIRQFSSIQERKNFPRILTYGNEAVRNVLEIGFTQAGLIS